MENACAIILAAGEGKRMNSKIPKVLCTVLDIPMIDWVLKACDDASIKKKCVVVGKNASVIKNHIKEKVTFSLQKEQKGTANAVQSAYNFLVENIDKDVFICYGDSPLLDKNTIIKAYQNHKKNKAAATIITTKIKDPKNFGRIVRNKNGEIIKIIEEKDATQEEKKINEINSGAYWFNVKDLLEILKEIDSNNIQHEYYLTDAVKILVSKNKIVAGFVYESETHILGANTKLELLKINEIAKNKVIDRLIEDGVEFISRDGILIYPDVKIGENTKILPGSIIKNSIIGENSVIGPNSLIENCKIGSNCKINSSQVYSSIIENNTTVGPFSHIRPNSKVSHNVKIGDFVEIKNSNIDAGTSISHLTYVGDSDVGKNVNFGCGVVTTNYDGVTKNRCEIDDGAFIGCNTNLIAPVKLGKNSYTGAGSTITKNVPDEALAIERTEQINVANFSKTKLAKRNLKVKN